MNDNFLAECVAKAERVQQAAADRILLSPLDLLHALEPDADLPTIESAWAEFLVGTFALSVTSQAYNGGAVVEGYLDTFVAVEQALGTAMERAVLAGSETLQTRLEEMAAFIKEFRESYL